MELERATATCSIVRKENKTVAVISSGIVLKKEREMEHQLAVDLRTGNTVTGHRSNIIENTGSRLERCLSNRGIRIRDSRIYATGTNRVAYQQVRITLRDR